MRGSPNSTLPKRNSAKSCGASGRCADPAEVRIFLDANILFSAAKSEGFVRRLLDLLAADGHTLCADAYGAEEARRNLATKGASGLPALQALLDRIEVEPIYADPTAGAAGRAAAGKESAAV